MIFSYRPETKLLRINTDLMCENEIWQQRKNREQYKDLRYIYFIRKQKIEMIRSCLENGQQNSQKDVQEFSW